MLACTATLPAPLVAHPSSPMLPDAVFPPLKSSNSSYDDSDDWSGCPQTLTRSLDGSAT